MPQHARRRARVIFPALGGCGRRWSLKNQSLQTDSARPCLNAGRACQQKSAASTKNAFSTIGSIKSRAAAVDSFVSVQGNRVGGESFRRLGFFWGFSGGFLGFFSGFGRQMDLPIVHWNPSAVSLNGEAGEIFQHFFAAGCGPAAEPLAAENRPIAREKRPPRMRACASNRDPAAGGEIVQAGMLQQVATK